jgi:glycerol dehydrogenase-like iron-containing ADH family enzyme
MSITGDLRKTMHVTSNASREISLPFVVEVEDQEPMRLDDILDHHGLANRNRIVVSSKRIFDRYHSYIDAKYDAVLEVTNGRLKETASMARQVLSEFPASSLLIAFGGGKIIDVVKYV